MSTFSFVGVSGVEVVNYEGNRIECIHAEHIELKDS